MHFLSHYLPLSCVWQVKPYTYLYIAHTGTSSVAASCHSVPQKREDQTPFFGVCQRHASGSVFTLFAISPFASWTHRTTACCWHGWWSRPFRVETDHAWRCTDIALHRQRSHAVVGYKKYESKPQLRDSETQLYTSKHIHSFIHSNPASPMNKHHNQACANACSRMVRKSHDHQGRFLCQLIPS